MKWNCLSILTIFSFLGCTSPGKSVADAIAGEGNAPEWSKNAVIYEINTRQFSKEGTFAAVEKELPRLKNLGVDILWFMPINPIGELKRKGTLGSYYSVKDYKGINPEYGNLEDFKRIVKKAHDLDLKVIIDWVANHTAWDHEWIDKHPDWYVKDSNGKITTQYDWSDVAKLNFKNTEMRKAMIADMTYWVKETDIDGFRCDVSFLVPVDFWEEARTQLEKNKKMFMLAEMEWNPEIEPDPARYFSKAFDAAYGWEFMGFTQDWEKGKRSIADWYMTLDRNYNRFPAYTYKMYFLSNHDENSWNGTIKEKYDSNWRLYSILAYTLGQSFPLIYNGDEANNNKRLKFFEKDPIETWADTNNYNWYRTMNALKHQNSALWNGAYGAPMERLRNIGGTANEEVFAFRRKNSKNEVVVVVNFGKKAHTFLQLGDWTPAEKVNILFGKALEFKDKLYHIPAKGWAVYYK